MASGPLVSLQLLDIHLIILIQLNSEAIGVKRDGSGSR